MKQLLLAALVLTAASCAAEDDSLKYQKVRLDPAAQETPPMPSETRNLQYMAWANDEGRALSGWVDSRGEAESKAHDYASEFPGRGWIILWRQKPGTEPMVPKYPRGG